MSKVKILVVEDAEIAQIVAKMKLTSLGFDVSIAEDGEKAVLLFKESPYDVVLMDLGLPGIDGFEATKQIRKMEETGKHVPIIGLTAYVDDSIKARCNSEGFDGVLSKPLSDEGLAEITDKLLKLEQRKKKER